MAGPTLFEQLTAPPVQEVPPAAPPPPDPRRDARADQAVMPGWLAAPLAGATFGWSDELVAGVRSGLGGTPYREGLAQERANRERFAEQNPKLAVGLEIAGALPTALIPFAGWGGAAARVAGTGGRIARGARLGAATGAVGGAIQGAGESQRSGLEMGIDAAAGAGVGGLLGGGAGAVLGRLASPVPAPVPGTLARDVAGDPALQQRAAVTIADEAERIAQRGTPGPGLPELPNSGRMMGEVLEGPGEQRMIAAANAATPGAAIVREAVETRARGGPNRVWTALQETFGDGEDAFLVRQASRDRQRASATPLYDEAWNLARQPGGTDLDVLRRVPQEAFGDARRLTQARGEPWAWRPRFEDGAITDLADASARDLHYVRRGLATQIDSRINGNNGRVDDLTRNWIQVREALDDRLHDLTRRQDGSSPYTEARRAWASESAEQAALDRGLELFRPGRTRAEWESMISRMSVNERDRFVQGAMQSLQDRLERADPDSLTSSANRVFRSTFDRDRVRLVGEALGLPPSEATRRVDNLEHFLLREREQAARSQRIVGNSQTAGRQEAIAAEDLSSRTTPLNINPLRWARQRGQDAYEAVSASGRDERGRNLATLVTETDPARQREMLSALIREGQAMRNPRAGFAGGVIGGAAAPVNQAIPGMLNYAGSQLPPGAVPGPLWNPEPPPARR